MSRVCAHASSDVRPFRVANALERGRKPLNQNTTSKTVQSSSLTKGDPTRPSLRWQRCRACTKFKVGGKPPLDNLWVCVTCGVVACAGGAGGAGGGKTRGKNSKDSKSGGKSLNVSELNGGKAAKTTAKSVELVGEEISTEDHRWEHYEVSHGEFGEAHGVFMSVAEPFELRCLHCALVDVSLDGEDDGEALTKKKGKRRPRPAGKKSGSESSSSSDSNSDSNSDTIRGGAASARDGKTEQSDGVAPVLVRVKEGSDAEAVVVQCQEAIRQAMVEAEDSDDDEDDSAGGFLSVLPGWMTRQHTSSMGAPSAGSVPVVRGLVGLQNLGNTCFFNSTMQCMLQAQPLRDLLLRSEEEGSDVGALTEAMRELAACVWEEDQKKKNRVLAPRSVFSQVQKMNPRFGGFRQQDAHELLVYLLEGLRMENAGIDLSEMNPAGRGTWSKITGFFSSKKSPAELDPVDGDGVKLVDSTFLGKTRSKLLCSVCGVTSRIPEETVVLSIGLPATTSLRDLRELARQNAAAANRDGSSGSTVDHGKGVTGLKKKWLQLIGAMPKDEDATPPAAQKTPPSYEATISGTAKATGDGPTESGDSSEVSAPLGGDREQRDAADDVSLADDLSVASAPFSDTEVVPVEGVREDRSSESEVDIDDLRVSVSEVGVGGSESEESSSSTGSSSSESEDEWVLDPKASVTVDDLLVHYVTPENLRGVNAVACSKCTKRARKRDDGGKHYRGEIEAQLRLADRRRRKMKKRAARLRKIDLQQQKQGNPFAYVKGAFASKPAPVAEIPPLEERIDRAVERNMDLLRPMTKTMEILALPPVLVIHLKRFEVRLGRLRKNDRRVEFPIRLDLDSVLHCDSDGDEAAAASARGKTDKGATKHESAFPGPSATAYRLFGVVVHMGGLGGGHYIAFRRIEDRWYRISDSSAKAASEADVLKSEAYMLWYQREK